jgi:hypothetical protein
MQVKLDGTVRQRPWQLLVVGDYSPSAEVLEEVETIFELYPAIPGVELHSETGRSCNVTRDYPAGHTDCIDDALQVIFAERPELAEVRFFGSEARASHVATRAEPFWHRDGKAVAEIHAQIQAGDITPSQAIGLLKSLFEAEHA